MKNVVIGALCALGISVSSTAMGQDAHNVSAAEAEIELAAARLAVAKAEAELAKAKLDALKLETDTSKPSIAPKKVNSETDLSALITPNIEEVVSSTKPVVEISDVDKASAAIHPVAVENVTEIGAEITTDTGKEITTDVPTDILSEADANLEIETAAEVSSSLDENENLELEVGAAPFVPLRDIQSLTPKLVEGIPELNPNSIDLAAPNIEKGVTEVSLTQALPETQVENVIFPGLLDLTRHEYTGPIDGCASMNKGLVMGGGFMLFTCEKLLPYIEITEHKNTYDAYKNLLLSSGWSETPSQEPAKNKLSFKRKDYLECEVVLDMELWVDRSMNETILDEGDRNNFRQIVFKAWFRGDDCEAHYETTELMVGR